MKKFIYCALTLCILSCDSKHQSSVEYPPTYISGERLVKYTDNPTALSLVAEVPISEKNRVRARKLAYGKEFIDFNLDSISNAIRYENRMPDEENGIKIKASIYRFYSHVRLVEDKLVCNVESGKDIQISERLFKAFSVNMEETNKQLFTASSQGVEVQLGEINERVLSTLFDY